MADRNTNSLAGNGGPQLLGDREATLAPLATWDDAS
jgi:hypothetical protein